MATRRLTDNTQNRSSGLALKVRAILTDAIRLLVAVVITTSLWAQVAKNVQRPRVLGIAHVSFFVSDLGKARGFYKDVFGFEQAFSLQRQDGTEWMDFIKVNDQQYLELFAGNSKNAGHLSHFALYTDDATRMRDYLISRRVETVDEVHKGQTGDRFFTVKDPDGHFVEIVEYQADSSTGRAKGKFMSGSRLSNHITHVGILVSSMGPAMSFYRDIFGLQETGRNKEGEGPLSWIDMRVPDGTDYVELMLDAASPSPEEHKMQNHVGFASSNVQETAADLQSRAAGRLSSRPIDISADKNQKPHVNLFDPDGARIEIMESTATSGK